MFKRFWMDLKKHSRYSLISAKSQLKAEVANSYLNWIWWILEPLCFMLIYAFLFGYVFDAKEQYFPAYIFIGLTMWNFFNTTISQSVKLVKNNKSIITRIYFPKFVLILIKIWINGFKMMISFGIVIVMIAIYRIPITWSCLYAIPIALTLSLFTFGCACFLMHYGVYVEDLSTVVKIVLRVLFYMTGVFYNIENKIPEWGALLNRANPIAFLMSSMRNCLLYRSMLHGKLLFLWFVISLLLSVAGIRKIYKEENSYAKAI